MENNIESFKAMAEQESNYMMFAVLPDGENTSIICKTGKAISTNNVIDSLKAILCTTYANLKASGYIEQAEYIKENIKEEIANDYFWNDVNLDAPDFTKLYS